MSFSSSGGARGIAPKPPEKGVFPLDHFGECKKLKEEYMKCLAEHDAGADACSAVAKAYLECRMDRNLMARQDIAELGLDDEEAEEGQQEKKQAEGEDRKEKKTNDDSGGASSSSRSSSGKVEKQPRTKEGFVAGLRPSSSSFSSRK